MIAAYVDSQPERSAELAAEPITEAELLDLMRKHCQKSWQATRWLLEIKFPERYCKRKGSAGAAPSVDQVIDAVSGVLAEEINDDALRGRIEARLESLAAQKFVAGSVPAGQRKPDRDGPSEAIVKSSENPQSSAAPPSFSGARSPEADGPDLPHSAEVQTLAEHSHLQPVDVAAAPAVSLVAVKPLDGPIDKPPPSPPATWMESARQQNEERKQQRKLRRQTRKKRRQVARE